MGPTAADAARGDSHLGGKRIEARLRAEIIGQRAERVDERRPIVRATLATATAAARTLAFAATATAPAALLAGRAYLRSGIGLRRDACRLGRGRGPRRDSGRGLWRHS